MLSIQPAIKSSLYCCLISKGRQTEREMLDGSTRRKREKKRNGKRKDKTTEGINIVPPPLRKSRGVEQQSSLLRAKKGTLRSPLN